MHTFFSHPFRRTGISQFCLGITLLISLAASHCQADEYHSVVEIDNEKANLFTVAGESVRVDVHEYKDYLEVKVTVDGDGKTYFLDLEYRTIKVDIKDAKTAAFNYQLGDESSNQLGPDRKLIYDGCDGFDTVTINLDYDMGGDVVEIYGAVEIDVTTGIGRDNVNVLFSHLDKNSGLLCNADLGDDDDFFRLFTRRGSDALAGVSAYVDAGLGADKLTLEYHAQSVFRDGLVDVVFDGEEGHDELRWSAAGLLKSPHAIDFYGGRGQDLMLGRVTGEYPNSYTLAARFHGEASFDALGFEVEGNPDWQGYVLLDGGPNHDYYYPNKKLNDRGIILENVEVYLAALMTLF